jgi:hypothetical protein
MISRASRQRKIAANLRVVAGGHAAVPGLPATAFGELYQGTPGAEPLELGYLHEWVSQQPATSPAS